MAQETDKHHILHNRVEWLSRPQARALRESTMLIPRLYRPSHEALHRECPPVPLLGYYAPRRTQAAFETGFDTLSTIDNLLFAIEEAAKNPNAHEIERALCQLAIQAVELQRPFIRDGEVRETRRYRL